MAGCLSDGQQLDVDSLQPSPESPSTAETSSGNPERVAQEPDATGRRCEEYALLKGVSKRIHEVRSHLWAHAQGKVLLCLGNTLHH